MSDFKFPPMKVVVNRCYGGFSLSERAIDKLKEYGFKEPKYGNWCGISRHDPILVKVVEELGEKANGSCSNLKVVEVYFEYEIYDNDGKERVESTAVVIG